MQKRIEVGKKYGVINVMSAASEVYAKNKPWTCVCEKCGNTFCYNGSQIFKYQNDGCFDCRKKEKQRKRIEDAEKHIGEIFGNLEIMSYSHMNKSNSPVMLVKCHKCGNDTLIPLMRILTKHPNQCVNCSKKNLSVGHSIAREAYTEGTLLLAIDGRRTINKNSSTGATGVSYHEEVGKYRAYIVFKRKQYYLGLYDNIEDAVKARKIAEKNIYGSFLEWYAKTYPDRWKRLMKNKKHDDN